MRKKEKCGIRKKEEPESEEEGMRDDIWREENRGMKAEWREVGRFISRCHYQASDAVKTNQSQ